GRPGVAPGQRRPALPPGARVAADAGHARPRLLRRPALSARRQRRRRGAVGTGRRRARPAARRSRRVAAIRRSPVHDARTPAARPQTAPVPGLDRVRVDWHPTMILDGADIVLTDRVVSPGRLVIEGDRIVDIGHGSASGALAGHTIVPGFVDVHVHGVEGNDVLEAPDRVREVAARMPRYGVTSFCPTTVA